MNHYYKYINKMNCITCYAKLKIYIKGDKIETCHQCLVAKLELIHYDKLNFLLDDYEWYSGFCEQCLYECETVNIVLCIV